MSGGTGEDADADRATAERAPEVVLDLPETARSEFKEPLGELFTDVASLRAAFDGPFLTVGDIVTYHFEAAGHPPRLAFVDGRTEREVAPERVRETLAGRPNRLEVENPPGTITAGLLAAIAEALADDGPTTIVVDGEEDLATVPAVLAAPVGATVVYGQPGEGMVAIAVTEDVRERFCELLDVFDGDPERARSLLEG